MIVVNATVLANLAYAGRIDLLHIYARIIIPSQVHEEILKGISAGYEFLRKADQLVEADWVDLVLLDAPKSRSFYKGLLDVVGHGEAARIAIAKERKIPFASDDLKARRVAKGKGVRVTGTLGMLKAALQEDELTVVEADSILTKMIQGGYRSPIRSLKELM